MFIRLQRACTVKNINIIRYTIPMLLFFLSFILIFFSIYMSHNDEKDINLEKAKHGMISVIEYKGHSYIIWGINAGGGIVHDPDCKCSSKEKKE